MDCTSSFASSRGNQRHGDGVEPARIVLLTPESVSKLRLMRHSRFVASTLKQFVAGCGELCWQVSGTNEYAIGGQWRRRADIGHLMEMTQGPNREALLSHLLASFERSGMEHVVLACDDYSLYVSFYAKFGFEKLDEIIELERFWGSPLPKSREALVRAYVPKDTRALMEVDTQSFPWLWQNSHEELKWYSSLLGVEVYVMENSEGTVVSYAGITLNDGEGHLDRLAVHPAWQRLGFGAALLSFVVRRMEQRGAKRISLSTQSHNMKSQSLYRKFGFHHTFRSQAIYGLRLDQVNIGK